MLAKIKTFLTAFKNQLLDLWNRSKVFLIAVGAAIIYFEWNKIKEAFLVYQGQKQISTDKKEDQSLATQENSANQQANALVTKAQNESAADDWNTKK